MKSRRGTRFTITGTDVNLDKTSADTQEKPNKDNKTHEASQVAQQKRDARKARFSTPP